jgi:hypothetical protein
MPSQRVSSPKGRKYGTVGASCLSLTEERRREKRYLTRTKSVAKKVISYIMFQDRSGKRTSGVFNCHFEHVQLVSRAG